MTFRTLIVGSFSLFSFELSASDGGAFEAPGEDLRACSWVIAMNPRLALQKDINDMKVLLSRRDISIVSSVPYPYESGEIVVATFLHNAYLDKQDADRNLDFVVRALEMLNAKGVEVICDPGRIDPRLGTGS